jgi:hypothetical protein
MWQADRVQTENDQAFRRSSFCGNGACVEVAEVDGQFLVRDSKNPDQRALSFTRDEWVAFVSGVEAGDFADM